MQAPLPRQSGQGQGQGQGTSSSIRSSDGSGSGSSGSRSSELRRPCTAGHGLVASERELEHVRVLGEGTCGMVTLVRHKESGVLFALKKMRKEKIIR